MQNDACPNRMLGSHKSKDYRNWLGKVVSISTAIKHNKALKHKPQNQSMRFHLKTTFTQNIYNKKKVLSVLTQHDTTTKPPRRGPKNIHKPNTK
jgi:hypothetical protein